jgi:hypothetical protein
LVSHDVKVVPDAKPAAWITMEGMLLGLFEKKTGNGTGFEPGTLSRQEI